MWVGVHAVVVDVRGWCWGGAGVVLVTAQLLLLCVHACACGGRRERVKVG